MDMAALMLARLKLEKRIEGGDRRGVTEAGLEAILTRCWGCWKELDIFEIKANCVCRECQSKQVWKWN